jgi:D-glycero-D-manno-heptose 1,7-bisphosphate phosphatase
MVPRQCAVLIGGLGTRLGALTANTPKPLLTCGDRPFLAWVLRELMRFGIERFVLLAGYRAEQVTAFVESASQWLPKTAEIVVSREPAPAGTGGALLQAQAYLDDRFLLINGDSWLDTNLARFLAAAPADKLAHILLRHVADTGRYGLVTLDGVAVRSFRERGEAGLAGLINGGIYVLRKDILGRIAPVCSLEKDVLPGLAAQGLASGMRMDGYFIDIGIPDDYARAQHEVPAVLRRPAVFFDRDGVLNEDHGWVGTRERFAWIDGAADAVRAANEQGFHAFVVTNQAGIAKGLFTEAQSQALNTWMIDALREDGAAIDDLRYCPFHPDGSVAEFRRASDCRKPAPGMLLDLISRWEVDASRSILIGDKDSDMEAARRAGVAGHLFTGGNVGAFTRKILRAQAD